jgi:O-methyltransferase
VYVMQKAIEHSVEKFFSYFNLKICRISTGKVPIVFYQVDPDFNPLYDLAQQKTQMTATDNTLRRERHYTLTKLLRQTKPFINQGNVAECGCWRGLSSYQIATNLMEMNFRQRYYIFDSFEGLSKFDAEDGKQTLAVDEEGRRKEFAYADDLVKDNLKEFDFIDYKKGWIPERFSEVTDMKFSFVHIDVDLYQPIKDSLEFFYPRLVPGGIIVLDDYGYLNFPGAKNAVDEFLVGKPVFFLPIPSGSAFIMKMP